MIYFVIGNRLYSLFWKKASGQSISDKVQKSCRYYSQSTKADNFLLSVKIIFFADCIYNILEVFCSKYFELHPKKKRLDTPSDNIGFREGTLLCEVSMNMCLVALSEQHAPFQCFPKRHAFATAHNATIPSEPKNASQVSAIRECLCRKAHEYGCMV